MINNLIRMAKGEVRPGRLDRPTAEAARVIYDDVRLSSLQVDGATALAGHAMERLVELDAHRQLLAACELSLHALLGEVQQQAVAQIKKIQRNLFSGWV